MKFTAASYIKAAAQRILARQFNRTRRQGQLPSGQTAKARPDYRVQSLRKDMAAIRSIESNYNNNDTQDKCLSCCEHLLSGGKNERPDALFSQAVAPLVTFIRGNDAFTLLGMTWADPDLIQVQENVIAKTVNSLSFAVQ